ncbi:MAG: HAD hydrolase-like protein [Rhodobacteraceae bacterium]|nr:HAD hydrolase-like protein [Paracoccaceae bacterium]
MKRPADKFLLFDLDGTLVDPARGIIGSCQSALAALGRPVPPHDDLKWIIGPPLRHSFATLLGGTDQAEAAVTLYRKFYADGGIFQAEPYGGIFAALSDLRQDGYRLVVCTAKPRPFARQVIAHFGFADYFDGLYGAELDGRFDDKGALIAHLFAKEGFNATQGCMIGDRDNDTRAAGRNQMASIGVLWGYGDARELRAGGATALCSHPHDLRQCVNSLMRA